MKKLLLSLFILCLSLVTFGQTPITGTFVLCQGATTNLANITPGGTWSSSNVVIASVGSSTGVVFGNSAGVATITYAMGSSWFVTQNVTVNPLPGANTSTSSAGMFVCVGSTITLTNPTPGGTWSSGTPAVGTIDPITGVITGIAPGTTLITYTLPTGCSAASLVFVGATPSPITGPTQVCVGSTIILSSAPGGGTWSSNPVAVATIGSNTGVVTGVSAGTATITYALASGCMVTYNITVNPVPAPIIGTPGTPGISICVGSSLTLTNAVPGGTWTSGTTAVATIGSASGTVTGVAPGTTIITYTLPTGCFATTIVSVTPTPTITGPAQVCVGSTIILSSAPGGGTWSSGSPAVATVGSGTGVVTGVSAGTAVITYMLPTGCMATHTVTVDPTPSIIFGPLRLCVGDVVTVFSTPPGGIWTSGTPAVATIGSSSGIITALAPGISVITYTLPGGCFTTAIVTVNPLPGAISGPSSVCVGSTITLGATPGGGTWISGTPTVATVGAGTGIVTGVSAGTTVITYMLPTGCMVFTTITVNPVPVIGISTGAHVCVGSTLTLPATPTGGIWTSSNTGIATVGATSGIVTGITPGIVTITYTLSTGCFASILLTVDPTPVISGPNTVCSGSSIPLTATPAGGTWSASPVAVATIGSTSGILTGGSAGVAIVTYMMPTGCFATYSVTVNPMPGPIVGSSGLPGTSICVGSSVTMMNAVPGGIWTSGNTAVATIGSTSGVLTGVSPGTAVITYTLPGGCFVTTIVTVNPMPTAIAGPTQVCVGSTITLTSSPGGGTWSSSTPTVGTVSGTGVVTGISPGTTVITYTLPGGCFVSVTVTVDPLPVIGITTGVRLCVGDVITLPATPTGGIWTSSNTAVATVGSSSGILTAVSPSTSTITYTLPTGCSASIIITVNPTPGAITGPSQVCVGSTIVLTGTGGGVWSSGSPTVATIGSSSGIVTGISPGVSVITYTLPSGCFVTATITVDPLPSIGITTGVRLCVGDVITLPATPTGGIWTSSNTAVATVGSSSGILTAVSPGTSVITYTLPTGCSASIIITVNPTPGAITGPSQVCVGSTIVLTGTGGGVWTSSSPSIATIGSSSGIVTGISPGVSVITYTLPSGCFVTAAITVDPVPVIGITTGIRLCVGDVITLPATPPGGIWTSSNTAVATIGSSSGILTAVSPGTSTITYTLPTGCSASIVITVNPTPGAISGPGSVCVGSSIVLTGTGGGVWSSGSPGIANIGSLTGVVTGISAGISVITYMLPGGCFVTTTITVNPTPTIGTSGLSAHVCVGGSLTLSSTPTGGTWTSGNTTIATVGSSSGVVTGVSPGIVTIFYTLPTGCFTAITVTVDPNPVITGPSNVCVGSAINLTGTPGGGIWTSSSPAVATVGSATGTVTGVSAGTAVITYMLPTGCYATTTITVDPLPLIGITTGVRVCVGGSFTMVATPPGGVWTSSNTTIATVGSSSGVITGVTPGIVTIVYTLSTGCSASVVVTVNPTPVISGPTNVCVGLTINLTGVPGGGTWSSSNPSVAMVGSATGIVAGISAGTVVITYLLPSGCFATYTVTVTSGVGPITGTLSICVGATTTLTGPGGGIWSSGNPAVATIGSSSGVVTGLTAGTATITFMASSGCVSTAIVTVNPNPGPILGGTSLCAGSTLTLSNSMPGGTWTSSNTSVATIGSSSGVVTGIAGGTTTIVYTLPSGCSVSMTLIVNPSPGPIVGPGSLCVGSSIVLTGSGGGTWTSSNTGIATVGSASGVVTGVAVGVVNITYSISTGCFSVKTITVNPNPAPIIGPAYVCVGSSVTLTCATPGGTWSSGSPAIATVGSGTGVVTGVAAGNVTITYMLPTGCFVTYTMPVKPTPCWPAAVNDLSVNEQAVEVFPNPAYDDLTIKTDKGSFDTYIITNEIGQVVIQNILKGAQTTIDIKTLAAGLYFITVNGESGSKVQKFVKM